MAKQWLAAREADLLPAPYYHVVFTLPAAIADMAYQNKAVIYDLLFKASAESLTTIAADPRHLGARVGITSVLHTWGSALAHHPHVHIIVAGGGISPDGKSSISCRSDFFLQVRVLSRLFRLLFPERLLAAEPNGSSMPSARSAGHRPCWPICRAPRRHRQQPADCLRPRRCYLPLEGLSNVVIARRS